MNRSRRWPLRVVLSAVLVVLGINATRFLPPLSNSAGAVALTTTTEAPTTLPPQTTVSSTTSTSTTIHRAVTTTTTTVARPTTTVRVTTTTEHVTPTTSQLETTTTLDAVTTTTNAKGASPNYPARGCNLDETATGFAPAGHCVVLEIGDSLGQGLGWGLAREFALSSGFTVIQKAKSSTGLCNRAFYNWPAQFALYEQLYRPHLAVILLGGNDEQGIYTGNGYGAPFGTAGWIAAYSAAIKNITATAQHYGTRVLWLGMPVARPYYYNKKLSLLNHLYGTVAGTAPGVTFLPTTPLLATPSGAFRMTAYVNHLAVDLRAEDGIHMSSYGYDLVATAVVRDIALLFHVDVHPAAPYSITG